MNNIREVRQLEVGDRVISHSQYHGYKSVGEIVRVTKTQALLSDDTRLKREYIFKDSDKYNSLSKVGGYGGYGSSSYYLSNPTLIRKAKITKCKNVTYRLSSDIVSTKPILEKDVTEIQECEFIDFSLEINKELNAILQKIKTFNEGKKSK